MSKPKLFFQILAVLFLLSLGPIASASADVMRDQPDDPVLAVVSGESIRLSDLGFPRDFFPSRGQLSEALARVVKERLLSEASLRAAFDTNPAAIEQINRLRGVIISRVYMESLLADLPAPADQDVKSFIESTPEFFSERSVYRYTDVLVLTPRSSEVDEVSTYIASLNRDPNVQYKNVENFVAWLDGHGYRYTRSVVAQASEEIDEKIFDVVSGLEKVGMKAIPDRESGEVRVLFFHWRMPEPADPKMVWDNIRSGLYAKAREKKIDEELDELLSKARVTIFDDRVDAAAFVAARRSAETPAPDVVSPPQSNIKQSLFVAWVPFVLIASLFAAIRMGIISVDLSTSGFRLPALRRALAIAFPISGFALVVFSMALLFMNGKAVSVMNLEVGGMPSMVAGGVSGLLASGLLYLVSLMSRPYLRSALALSVLLACQAVFFVGVMRGW